MKRITQLLNASLATIAALGLFTASASAAPNNVKFRNCTDNILYLRSFNSWDDSMAVVYPGEGSAVIPQRTGILAKNNGAGETGQVGCNDWWMFKSYNTCKVEISCDSSTPCKEVQKNFEEGDWVYYSPTDIQKGSTCQSFIGSNKPQGSEVSVGPRALPAPGGGASDCLSTSQPNVILNNGIVQLNWQADGNLVLYRNGGATPVWASNTAGRATTLCFQGDGNLVIYNGSAATPAVWATGTDGRGARLKLQKDCNLVVEDQAGNAVWSAGTKCY